MTKVFRAALSLSHIIQQNSWTRTFLLFIKHLNITVFIVAFNSKPVIVHYWYKLSQCLLKLFQIFPTQSQFHQEASYWYRIQRLDTCFLPPPLLSTQECSPLITIHTLVISYKTENIRQWNPIEAHTLSHIYYILDYRSTYIDAHYHFWIFFPFSYKTKSLTFKKIY